MKESELLANEFKDVKIKFNGDERAAYLIVCMALEKMEQFKKSKAFSAFPKKSKIAFSTAITNLIKFREETPHFMQDNQNRKRLLEERETHKLEMRYMGSDSVVVNGNELKDLIEYTIESKCFNCKKTPIEVKKCRFKKRWKHIMDENDIESRSNACEFSFTKHEEGMCPDCGEAMQLMRYHEEGYPIWWCDNCEEKPY